MNFDLVSFGLGIAVGLGIAYGIVWMLGRALYRRIEAALQEQEQEEKQEKDAQRINMKVEQHGDVLYAFRSDNDGFVCQGADLRELRQQFAQRFPNHTGSVIGKTDELHAELMRQLKEIKNESSTSVGSSS